MFRTSRFALVVAVAATFGVASPALAQSVDHTGTLFASHYDGTGKQTIGSWGSQEAAPRAAGPQVAANKHDRAVLGRGLYATTVVPYGAVAPAAPSSGYDPSIATQR